VWCDSVYLVCLLNASCVVFFTFMHLHRCISYRYARCMTRGTKGQCWSRARRWCMGGPIQKTEELTTEGLIGVHAWTGDDVKLMQDCKLTNWLLVKPRQAPEHNLYFQYSMLLFKYCVLSFLGVEKSPSMHVSP